MSSLGAVLRSERLRQGLTLEQIAEEIKVSPRQLQFIEEEEYDKLPGAVFARNFTRQYAQRLGIPSNTIAPDLQEIDGVFALPDDESATQFRPVSFESTRTLRAIPQVLMWAVPILLASFALYWVYERLQPKAAATPAKIEAVRPVQPTPR